MWTLLSSPLNDVVTSDQVTLTFIKIPEVREVSKESYNYNYKNFQIQKKLHPEVAPLQVKAPREIVFEKAVEIARSTENLEVLSSDVKAFQIEAVATTAFFKFKDDVLIKILSENGKSIVHMRSKSRLGKSDLGANAKRIKSILSRLEKELEP